ncbi:RpiR family transcriptional regulator [Thermoanaerobacterium thermosaccharolyticum]|uniref:RpiR family transcriptional regulator n=1 Tax=Thermoanaerobacterium thermosaccharolyticum TaxID=1517 RepID=A0A223HWZ4_THETR|nr:RpiR family transcriptional regulator [Thermoanaerobacterium thermosaccharolyticum]
MLLLENHILDVTKEVVEAIKVAKDAGATTISLSKLGQFPLVKIADIKFVCIN